MNNKTSQKLTITTNQSFLNKTGFLDAIRFDVKHYFNIEYEVPIYGYISPVVICITVATNLLVLFVLLKKHMRSPTNTILAGIAVSDMLLGVSILPFFIYLFGLGNYKENDWCVAYFYIYGLFPEMFHTVSIWQTVTLTIQRYLLVHHTDRARKWLSITNIKRIIVVIYVIAMCVSAMKLLHLDIQTTERPSSFHTNRTINGCIAMQRPWLKENRKIYLNIYWLFRAIFISLIPCALLIVLNMLLFSTLRSSYRRRKQVLGVTRSRSDDKDRTTSMLVIVVGLFTLVEIPVAIDMVIIAIQIAWEVQIYTEEANNTVPILLNFFILVSSPLNFFIYCAMGRRFRETFKSMFKRKRMPEQQIK